MPLPTNGSAWPPPGHAPALDAMAEWSAWYAGDPDQLATVYGGNQPRPTSRPSQYAGGLVGAVSRMWWGTPTRDGETRAKLHVPLAADIAGVSADLLFSEPVKLAAEDTGLQTVLDDLKVAGLDAQLHEAAEIASALGGTYLRNVWNSDVQDLPWLDAIQPDGAFPEFRYGRVVAVTLWTQLHEIDSGTVHRMLERHESGAIEYALYAGTSGNLGKRVPLQDHPGAAGNAELVNADGLQLTGTKRLTVTYVPNMLPNREHRRSHLGRSDLQGVEGLLDALDEAYSSWWRDIRHGKSRLHVPAQYLDAQAPGTAAIADVDREIYVPLDGVLAGRDNGLMIDAQQFAIRYAEHAQTCADWANRAVQGAGYSAATFGESDGTAMTAAEVQQREKRSYMTRGKKIRYWTLGLQEALATLVEVSNANQGLRRIPVGDIAVEFGSGVQDGPLTMAQTALALSSAQAASTATLVKTLHPDWDQSAIDNEVAAIHTQNAIPVPGNPGLPGDSGL